METSFMWDEKNATLPGLYQPAEILYPLQILQCCYH